MQKTKISSVVATFVVCFVFWVLLDFSFKGEELLAGAVVSLLVALFSSRFFIHEDPKWFLNPGRFLSCIGFWCGTFVGELVKANLNMARICFGGCKDINPGIVKVPTEMKSDYGLAALSTPHMGDWADTNAFAAGAVDGAVEGVHAFWHENIFEAVYCTNLLMRSADVLLTKPSELAFYPVPKLFIKRIGGHEQWGAVHSAEIGDGTLECRDIPHTLQMLELFLREDELLAGMCRCIMENKKAGVYDGAYKAVQIAMALKNRYF